YFRSEVALDRRTRPRRGHESMTELCGKSGVRGNADNEREHKLKGRRHDERQDVQIISEHAPRGLETTEYTWDNGERDDDSYLERRSLGSQVALHESPKFGFGAQGGYTRRQ